MISTRLTENGSVDKNSEQSVTRIKTEAQLLELFRGHHEIRSTKNNVIALREFDCSNGVADLVLVELAKGWAKRRQLGLINPRWLYALKQLPYRKSFSALEFTPLAGVTRRRALMALSEFAKAGYCKKTRVKDVWIKIRQPRPVARRICAIEAKLTDWRRALIQATRYLDFAHQAWVLMDMSSCASAIANVKEFQRLNVGLAAVSASRKIRIYSSPTSATPRSAMRLWQANSMIASGVSVRNK